MLTKTNKLEPENGSKTRLIMIGGFLGAGKTTAVENLAQFLQRRGLKVALITNDQGKELVDTATLRSRGFPTEEVDGGCFGRRFDLFTDAALRLRDSAQPDFLIAEPVGICTDLVATVQHPLRRFFRRQFSLAPLSIMVDAVRAARVFGLDSGERFSEKVAYIYKKQIEEADLLVINKSDLISPASLARLKSVLAEHSRDATVLTVSARSGEGLPEWFERLLRSEESRRDAVSVDYDLYAEGEASLGWFNCTVRLSSVRYFEAAKVLTDLTTFIQALLQQEGAEIAHLKTTFTPGDQAGEIAVVSLVSNDSVPRVSRAISEPVQSGEMLLNLRAEGDPEILLSAVTRALLVLMERSPDLFARMEHSEHFKPPRPQPTHRIASLASEA